MIPNAHIWRGNPLPMFRVRLRIVVWATLLTNIQPMIRKPLEALPQTWCTGVDWSTASLQKRGFARPFLNDMGVD